MNLRPNRRRPPDIVVIPLLDVLLVLLIFFMVSTTFKDEARLKVQLPQAQGQDLPAKEPEHMLIVIDRTGAFYVDDRAVVDQGHETLVRALRGALGERKPVPVLIQADAQTPHQAVMTAMDAAAELGLTRIAFSATRAGPETPGQQGTPGKVGTDSGAVGAAARPASAPAPALAPAAAPRPIRPAVLPGDPLSIPIPPPTLTVPEPNARQ
jgi:biopolymer transport protein ExbD